MRVALVTYFFPPFGFVQRPLRVAELLARHGIETHVVAPADAKWPFRDDTTSVAPAVAVHRVRFFGPRVRRLAD